jgi:hypothetical protein
MKRSEEKEREAMKALVEETRQKKQSVTGKGMSLF